MTQGKPGKPWAECGNSDEEDDIVFRGPNTGKKSEKEVGNFPDLADLSLNDDEEGDEHESSFEDDDQEGATSEEDSSSEIGEDEEERETIEPYNLRELPRHACRFCGVHDAGCVARCTACDRWFCNGTMSAGTGTHIVQHLVRAKHKEVALHADSPLGDTILECYNCGNRNIFLLGFIPARADTVVVLLCRQPCATSAGGAQDSTWDLDSWTPLISQRALLPWLVAPPSQEEQRRMRPITAEQIVKLEELWRTRPDADIGDLTAEKALLDIPVARTQLHYESAMEYHSVMAPLVELEAEQDKASKEAQRQENVAIRWDMGLNMKRVAWLYLPATGTDADFRITAGDEVEITHKTSKWKASGSVIKVPTSSSEEIAVELFTTSGSKTPPSEGGYSVDFVWKSVPYDRMQLALKLLALNDGHVDPAILDEILGRAIDTPDLSVHLPTQLAAPGLPELNHSQAHAVRHVLQRPLSLIQGPPGTGKTVTSATIVYHLAKQDRGPVLVCAPSNVAVDHLTEKIHKAGLRVVRIAAKWREDIDSSISFLTLHSQLARYEAVPELKKLIKLKEELGELSAKDERRFTELRARAERDILKAAQVICTTAIGAGDGRLRSMKFAAVLLDEATQAVEPEALIPLVHGPRQVVLVGDHRQLGPVVLNKKAVKAGFAQSLFERLIQLGIRPVRLQVQYRMHPCLSEFPSNMFYEGALQNGITQGDRARRDVDFPWPNPDAPMFFLASVGTEELSASGTSFLNRTEASHVEKIVTRLLKAGVLPSQIGVITPYDGQRAYLVHYMQSSGSLPSELYAQVEVASVDAFQGREKDYIILSCVRSNDAHNIGFLSDARRLNVALTRAKYGLIILGNPRVLSRNLLWHHLVSHFKEHSLLMEGTLGSLRPCLLQLARPRPLQLRDNLPPAHGRPDGASFSLATAPYNLPSHPSAPVNLDTISQSGYDTVSLGGLSQISQAGWGSGPYSQARRTQYFAGKGEIIEE